MISKFLHLDTIGFLICRLTHSSQVLKTHCPKLSSSPWGPSTCLSYPVEWHHDWPSLPSQKPRDHLDLSVLLLPSSYNLRNLMILPPNVSLLSSPIPIPNATAVFWTPISFPDPLQEVGLPAFSLLSPSKSCWLLFYYPNMSMPYLHLEHSSTSFFIRLIPIKESFLFNPLLFLTQNSILLWPLITSFIFLYNICSELYTCHLSCHTVRSLKA